MVDFLHFPDLYIYIYTFVLAPRELPVHTLFVRQCDRLPECAQNSYWISRCRTLTICIYIDAELNWRSLHSLACCSHFFFLYNIHYCVLYILMGFLARFHLLLTFLTVIVNQIFLRTKIFRTQNMFACTLNTHTHKCALVSLGVNCICGMSKCSRVEPFFLLEQTRKKNTKIDKPHESDCRCCCYSFDTQRPVNQRRRFISPSI